MHSCCHSLCVCFCFNFVAKYINWGSMGRLSGRSVHAEIADNLEPHVCRTSRMIGPRHHWPSVCFVVELSVLHCIPTSQELSVWDRKRRERPESNRSDIVGYESLCLSVFQPQSSTQNAPQPSNICYFVQAHSDLWWSVLCCVIADKPQLMTKILKHMCCTIALAKTYFDGL